LTLRFLELIQQLRLLLLDYYLEGEMVHQETSLDSTAHKERTEHRYHMQHCRKGGRISSPIRYSNDRGQELIRL
jgi:hypothetical protein